jgi:hypothetical protein
MWYERIEQPLKEIIHILRNNGFNTTCSCGHYPNPYIQMEWYDGAEDFRLWSLLHEKGYKNWQIKIHWDWNGNRIAEVVFYHYDWNEKKGLATLKDILEIKQEKV